MAPVRPWRPVLGRAACGGADPTLADPTGATIVIAATSTDDAPVPGEDRPGRLKLRHAPGLLPGDPEVEVRFPHSPNGGHVVTRKHGRELADDVCRWLGDRPIP